MAAAAPFVFKAVSGYLVGRVVSEATGNKTLGMVAGALTSYGMSSAMSGAASAGATAGTATAGDVAANSAGSAAPAAGSSVSAGAATGTGTAVGGAAGTGTATAGGAATTGISSAGSTAGGASGGLLSKAWDGAKSYAASDAGKQMIAETLVGGVKGYAETKQAKKLAEKQMKHESEEAEKARDFRARHDAAVSDPALYRMGQSGERTASSFLDDKHQGLLSLYEKLYSKERMDG